MIRVLLADDHDVFRLGLRRLLESDRRLMVCGEAKDGLEAIEKALECRPDVVVIDLSMPKLSGIEAIRRIRALLPKTEILVFTVHETESLLQAVINAGAHGYILKTDISTNPAAAVEAIAQRHLYFSAGVSKFVLNLLNRARRELVEEAQLFKTPLTPRQIEVVRLLAQGKTNKEIAALLSISVRTVETHRRTIVRRLGLGSFADLIRYAIRQRLIVP